VPHWPVEWGGTGWSAVQLYLFRDEMQQSPAPEPLPFGVNMIGPVLIAFGSEAQKKRFLPRIANLDDWWCQGFSEPDAGSDLAAVRKLPRGARAIITSSTARRPGHARAICRLDFLPRAHRPGGEKSSKASLSADRHEDARRYGAADPDLRRRA
jgi:hypothetical protein